MTFKSQPAQMVCGMNVAGCNLVDTRGRWHLSYNPRTAGYGCVTTALVFDNRVFWVLDGDHRQAWGQSVTLLDAVDYFATHRADANRTSEHLMALGLKADPFGTGPTVRELLGAEAFQALRAAFTPGGAA